MNWRHGLDMLIKQIYNRDYINSEYVDFHFDFYNLITLFCVHTKTDFWLTFKIIFTKILQIIFIFRKFINLFCLFVSNDFFYFSEDVVLLLSRFLNFLSSKRQLLPIVRFNSWDAVCAVRSLSPCTYSREITQ